MNTNKCKVFLLSGFLGSGKTTLLKHLISTCPQGEKVAVLINEFGKAGVDGDIVRKNGLEIMEISRGSIFCTCAKGDFLRGLYTILKEYSPTVLMIEASGVADTTDMKKDLGNGMLNNYYQMSGNICVVDAKRFEAWLDMFNAVLTQIKAATAIVVNKTDQICEAELEALIKHIEELNPEANITSTSFGNIDWSFIYDDETNENAAEKIPNLSEWEAYIEDTMNNMTPHMAPPDNLASLSVFWSGDPDNFKKVLSMLPDDIIRSKGYYIDSDGRWKIFNIVGNGEPIYSDADEGFEQPRNLAIFIRKIHNRREIPAIFQDNGLKLLELRF